jgi:hypothetical protein
MNWVSVHTVIDARVENERSSFVDIMRQSGGFVRFEALADQCEQVHDQQPLKYD